MRNENDDSVGFQWNFPSNTMLAMMMMLIMLADGWNTETQLHSEPVRVYPSQADIYHFMYNM